MKSSFAWIAVSVLSLAACFPGGDDCYHEGPSTAWLSSPPSEGPWPEVGAQQSVGVQFFVDQGELCNDGFEGCHCSDRPPALGEFEIVDAECLDQTCTVVGIESGVWYLQIVDVVTTIEQARLRVRARSVSHPELTAEETITVLSRPKQAG